MRSSPCSAPVGWAESIARDPRLGRDVAVTVLPAAFSADSDRLRRFEQEARAAAAITHPNILAVYDIGVENGAPMPRTTSGQSGRRTAVVSSSRRTARDIMTVNGAGTTLEVGAVRSLTGVRLAQGTGYDVTADGQRVLLATAGEQTTRSPITVVLNWQAALNK